jgi:class 3 adenylate cyclase/tetratricopeptide (TPR) repeat protein
LFCDLVGSVTLASQLDPEEWRGTVAGYQRAASEAITRFGGEVVRYVGDGIMAFFGYPVAHDNDAERAARAGLAIIDAVAQLTTHAANAKLSVRVGIDSGPVVVGAGAGKDVDAFGDAANVAARVQAVAEPDTVMVTGETHKLLSGLFVVEDRGAHQLKGVERGIQLYRVVRPSGIRGRFEAAAAAGNLTRFVGREDDLRSLMSRWARTRNGEGQVVTISGEAGIGKSRLVRRFREEIAANPHLWLQAGAGVFFQSTPFYPVAELIRQLTGGGPAADPIAQLESSLGGAGLNPAEAIPLLAPLLNLPPGVEYPPATMSPEQQRRRLLATLVEWVLRVARDRPLVIVIEDLHWIDPSTLELVQLLVEQGANTPLLLLYTARPEFRPPWPQRAHHLHLTLDRLSSRDVQTMVGAVVADRTLNNDTIAMLVERTGGVPLFVEELTRAVLEGGDGAGSDVHVIPATLHDSLTARLDRLGQAKEIMQVGAVIGRDFSYELLRAVHPIDEAALQQALRSLSDAELLYARGIAPEATYQFKHALIRDAAYEALLKSRRRELHRAVARSLEEKFDSIKETHPEVLARHWTEAGAQEPAIAAWQAAGDSAGRRNAAREAAQHYLRALELLPPIDDERRATLLLALGQQQRRSGQSIAAHETFIRSGEIAESLGSIETVQQAATELVRLNYTVGLSTEAALRLLNGALAHSGRGDTVMRAQILADLGTLMVFDHQPELSIDYAEQAVAMSRRLGNPEALQHSLHGAVFSYGTPQFLRLRVACARERVELFNTVISNQIKDYDDQFSEALSHLEEALTELGDIAAADAVFSAWESYVETYQSLFGQALVTSRGSARALMRGDFELSERLARDALEIGQRIRGDNASAGLFGFQMFAISRERGKLKELEPLVRLFLQDNSLAETWRPGLAFIYAELDRRDEARREFDTLATKNFEDLPRDSLWMAALIYSIEICVYLDDQARASILYKLLLPFERHNVTVGYGVVCYGAASRYLGMLSITLQRRDDAARHFEDALAMNARMEAWPWLAHTQYQYAAMLSASLRPADRDRAFALLDSAKTAAERLGMNALQERIAALLSRQSESAKR